MLFCLRRRHSILWCLFALTIANALAQFGAATVAPATVFAQEEEATEEAAPASDPASGGGGAKKQENFLIWLYNALTLRYTLAFLALSFALVALIIMNIIGSLRDRFVPPALVDSFEACTTEKKWQEAYDTAKNDPSFLGQMLAAGLERLSTGFPQAMEAMQEVGEDENMKAEHRLSYIALIGTLAPMVGLLGTVDGMIMAFSKIAGSETQPKASELAEGISTALVTTCVGLILAIPAIAFFNIVKNMIARRVLESGIQGERLIAKVHEAMGAKR